MTFSWLYDIVTIAMIYITIMYCYNSKTLGLVNKKNSYIRVNTRELNGVLSTVYLSIIY